MRRFLSTCLLLSLPVGLALAPQVPAATYTVGTGGGCTHSTIQAALDTAANATDTSVVRITRSATWSAQALTLIAHRNVTLEGGYATCTQSANDGIKTTISGSGGVSAPVLSIGVPTTHLEASIRYLTFRDGDAEGNGRGGGIRLTGTGTLTLADTTIQNNFAGFGGGIHAEGSTAAPVRLVLRRGVLVLSNTARQDGGGIYLDKAELTMNEPDTLVFGNLAEGQNATGYGGGLAIRGTNTSAIASIGGSGANGLAAIHGNQARFGGGVAILGAPSASGPGVSELRLYTRDAARPGAIRANAAAVAGGGIYLRPHEGSSPGSNVSSSARLWRVAIEDNTAPEGSAVFLERHAQPQGTGIGGRLEIDFDATASPGLPCEAGSFCSRITGNITQTPSGQPQAGATIWTNTGTVQIGSAPVGLVQRGGTRIEGNRAGRLIDGLGCVVLLAGVQITANTLGRQVIGGNCHSFELNDLTIAGNSITQSAVLELQADVILRRSIIWQPGKTTLVGGGTRSIADIVTSERGSLDTAGALFVEQADPRFIDPANGDYGLRAASPAVDYALAVAGDDRDARGEPRDVDLPIHANFPRGPRDLGALERQSLQPLVLNADFDFSDLRLWTHLAGSWDGSQNAVGAPGSGSWSYSGTGLSTTRVVLGRQCIHLPGPGRYRLNGRGRAGGNTMITRDYAVLAWEFRRTGTEPCNFGPADAFGELTVGSGTSWGQAAAPAIINVGPADWSPTSSITVSLVAVDGGIVGPPSVTLSAWFDGITLEVDGSDVIFADGFEAP